MCDIVIKVEEAGLMAATTNGGLAGATAVMTAVMMAVMMAGVRVAGVVVGIKVWRMIWVKSTYRNDSLEVQL